MIPPPASGSFSDPSKKPPASGTSEASPGSNEKKDTPDPESGRRARILRWIRRGLLATLLLVFFAFLFYVRETLLPFILAVVIAYIFSPVVNWLSTRNLKGKRIPRWIAVILIYIVLFLNIYIFSVTVVPRFASEFGKLAVETPTLFRKASQVWVPQATDSLKPLREKTESPAFGRRAREKWEGFSPRPSRGGGNPPRKRFWCAIWNRTTRP